MASWLLHVAQAQRGDGASGSGAPSPNAHVKHEVPHPSYQLPLQMAVSLSKHLIGQELHCLIRPTVGSMPVLGLPKQFNNFLQRALWGDLSQQIPRQVGKGRQLIGLARSCRLTAGGSGADCRSLFKVVSSLASSSLCSSTNTFATCAEIDMLCHETRLWQITISTNVRSAAR